MKVTMRVAALVALLLLPAAALGACGDDGPALTGTTLQGEAFDLASLEGPAVVNFFASWCPPCNEEMPAVVDAAAANPDVAFVGVATNDKQADTQAFVDKYQVPYPVVMDESGTLGGDWGVQYIPTTFFIDADGVQQASIVGAASAEQLEENLQKIK
jgi:thiol-disulfide isomerase/thioredoxin